MSGGVPADELLDSLTSDEELDQLREVPAIYMWRLRLEPTCHPSDAPEVMKHYKRLARLPQGETGEIPLGRMARVTNLELGGVAFPEKKAEHLDDFLASPENSSFLHEYLSHLERTLPALYCGESDNLRRRTKEHLTTPTRVNQLVKDEANEITWADLRLDYVYLEGDAEISMSENQRKALEYFTGVMCVAAYTKRLG